MADHIHVLHSESGRRRALTFLQETAEGIAAKSDWGALYDSAALGKNQVPVASATYYEVISTMQSLSLSTSSPCCKNMSWREATSGHAHAVRKNMPHVALCLCLLCCWRQPVGGSSRRLIVLLLCICLLQLACTVLQAGLPLLV